MEGTGMVILCGNEKVMVEPLSQGDKRRWNAHITIVLKDILGA